MPSRARRFVQKMHGLDASLKLLVSVGTSIVAVVGALIAGFAYVTEQVNAAIDERVGEVEQKLEVQRQEQELSLTRLELLTLIHDTPENRTEIERVAKHYLCDLKGDWYMTGVYSAWAEQHNGDIGLVVN